MLKLKEITKKFEEIVPIAIQWEKDNTGLQIGDTESKIHKILLCLEVTDEIVRESIEKKVDLIFSHHPLIFTPLKRITPQNSIGNIIYKLIQNNLSLYSSHTNLDKYNKGVSYSFARKLELKNLKVLIGDNDLYQKIVTFVPKDSAEDVIKSLAEAGAGIIGDYQYCAFRSNGTGSFIGSENSYPHIGRAGQKEFVEEVRIEMLFPNWKSNDILKNLKTAHPYEEPAYDIYDIKKSSSEFGYGIIGELEIPIAADKFIEKVKSITKRPFVRVSGDQRKEIKKVAVLGGAGGSYYSAAKEKGADVFISSEISYHTFLEAKEKLLLIDAGHFETEIFVLDELEKLLMSLYNDSVEILKTENITNPITYI